jgi:sugar phosphate isomerase/epimerase
MQMGKVSVGLNLEFVRHHDKPFEWAVDKAAELGYEYIEPMVHFGRELMSEAGYYHTVSMFDDPYRIRRAAEKAGVKLSGLQAHGPLGRPDVHGEYLKLAIRHAKECGAPVVNTDEGIKAKWTTEEEDFVLIRYTLQEAAFVAEPRGILIGLECHAQYSKTPDGLDRIYNTVKSPCLGINLDTGNAYLAGQDPYP